MKFRKILQQQISVASYVISLRLYILGLLGYHCMTYCFGCFLIGLCSTRTKISQTWLTDFKVMSPDK